MSWRSGRLGDVLTLKRGHDLPDSYRQDGDVPVVSSSGITGFHNEAKAKAPGVVTGRYGTIGQVFYLEDDYWPLNTALYVLDFKGNDPRFASYLLRNLLRNYQSSKAAVPGVNRNVLHELNVRYPDVRSQVRIAEILSAYDESIENNQRRMALLEETAHQIYCEWFVRLRFPGHEHSRIADGVPQSWQRKSLAELCESIDYGYTASSDLDVVGCEVAQAGGHDADQPVEHDLQHWQPLVGHEAGADDLLHARAGFAVRRTFVEAQQVVDFRLVQLPRRLHVGCRGLGIGFRAPGGGELLVGLLGRLAH